MAKPPKKKPVKTIDTLPETPENETKLPRLYGKTKRAMKLVIEHGVDIKEALVLANDGKKLTSGAISHFREKVRRHSLTAPGMVKLANQAIKDALQMKPITYEAAKVCAGIGVVDYTETIMPTITNRLAAASMVMDRDQPVVRQNVNLNANVDISPVDLSKYFNR